MKRAWISAFGAVALMATAASGTTITSMFGDADGFGIGVTAGSEFDWTAVTREADDAGLTDQWIYGAYSWTQTFDLSGLDTITSATLEIFHGGDGWEGGVSKIYIDDIYLGTLTDCDGADGSREYGTYNNFAALDSFDLMSFGVLLDGASTLRIETFSGGDGWALDYSKLTIADAAVPEPATMVLLGSGLLGLVATRRRTKK